MAKDDHGASAPEIPDEGSIPEGYAPVVTSGFLAIDASQAGMPDEGDSEGMAELHPRGAVPDLPAPEPDQRVPVTGDTSHTTEFPELQFGDSGGKVQQLQYLLGQRNTGTYDEGTQELVRNLQRSDGLPETGVCGAREWCLVLPKLKFGDQGVAVGSVQRLLGIDDDNRFDKRTREAIEKLQGENGLTESGETTVSTYQLLLGLA